MALSVLVLSIFSSAPATAQTLANGSFEEGYTGWTLSDGDGTLGMWVALSSGTAIDSNQVDIFDQADSVLGPALCISNFDEQPLASSAGDNLALLLQNVDGTHRMYQDVTLPDDAHLLRWDMAYENTAGVFEPQSQEFTLNVRDVDTDATLAQLYATREGVDADRIEEMTEFTVDLSAFAGQSVRLDITHWADDDCFPLLMDNFEVTHSCGDGVVQGADECDDGPEGSSTCSATCKDIGPSSPEPDTDGELEEESGGCATGAARGTLWLVVLLIALARRRN